MITILSKQIAKLSGRIGNVLQLFVPFIQIAILVQTSNAQETPAGKIVPPTDVSISQSESQLLDVRTQAISDSVMSPYCPGRTLSACPSDQARILRSKIFGWLKDGTSDEAVYSQLKSLFGQEIEGAPEAKGFGLVGWVMPAVFLIMGIAAVVVALRVMGIRQQNSLEKTACNSKADDKERIASEIRDRLAGRV